MPSANAREIAYWNGPVGKVWAKEQEKRDQDHAEITKAVLALASARSGEHVVDIGCGSGTTTMMLAEAVGAKGSVTGIDLSAPMLEVAKARAGACGSRANFIEADAADYAFKPRSFDLGFSQFGVMFFADPVAAFANIREALKEGGRIVFACWCHPFENPWSHLPETTAKPFLPPAAPAVANAPGRYSLADPDRVRSVLLQAGFHAPDLKKFDTRIHLGNTPQEAASSSIDAGPLLRILTDFDDETKAKVRAAVTERLAKEMGPGGIYLTAGCWLVDARA